MAKGRKSAASKLFETNKRSVISLAKSKKVVIPRVVKTGDAPKYDVGQESRLIQKYAELDMQRLRARFKKGTFSPPVTKEEQDFKKYMFEKGQESKIKPPTKAEEKKQLKQEIESNAGKTWVDQYRKGRFLVKGHWRKVSQDAKPKNKMDEAKLRKIYKNMVGKSDKEQLRLSRDIAKFGEQIKPTEDIYKRVFTKAQSDDIKKNIPKSLWADAGYAVDDKGNVYQVLDREYANVNRARDFVAAYAEKAGYRVTKDTFNRPKNAKYSVSAYLELEKPVRQKINGRWETRWEPLKKIRFSDHATGESRAGEEIQITKGWLRSPNLTPEELYKLAKEI